MGVSVDGKKASMTKEAKTRVSVIDLATNTVLTTISAGFEPTTHAMKARLWTGNFITTRIVSLYLATFNRL
jgi:hypothetical protein